MKKGKETKRKEQTKDESKETNKRARNNRSKNKVRTKERMKSDMIREDSMCLKQSLLEHHRISLQPNKEKSEKWRSISFIKAICLYRSFVYIDHLKSTKNSLISFIDSSNSSPAKTPLTRWHRWHLQCPPPCSPGFPGNTRAWHRFWKVRRFRSGHAPGKGSLSSPGDLDGRNGGDMDGMDGMDELRNQQIIDIDI